MKKRQDHILNASSNLLGICFVLITGLKLTDRNATTFADEVATFSALMFLVSVVFSYLAIRKENNEPTKESGFLEDYADYSFLAGILSLFISVVMFSTNYL